MELQTVVTCLIALTLITLTPGLDTMLVIRNSARGGWRDGAVSSLGICSGLFVHASISVLGISILLLQTAWAFSAIKLTGAGYLIWLGLDSWIRIVKQKGGAPFADLPVSAVEFNGWRSFREGFLSNVLNPKIVIFYMAFLPQFIDLAKAPVIQSLLVAGAHFAIAMLWLFFLASMVDRSKSWLQDPQIGRFFDTLTGSVMVYLGFRLVLDD